MVHCGWNLWSNSYWPGRRRSHLLRLRDLLLVWGSNAGGSNFFLFLCLFSWIKNLGSLRWRIYRAASAKLVLIRNRGLIHTRNRWASNGSSLVMLSR